MRFILPVTRALLPMLAVGLIAGCGLKGDLYLPPPESGAPPPDTQADTDPERDASNDDDDG